MSILINLAAEFTGKKAFKSADKSISGLDASAKKLAKSLAATFSVGAVTAFGKAAAQAFMDDEKSAAQLSNSLKNLGLAFADLNIKNYISELALASGTVDDELRPAFQRLLQATKSVNVSQDLLTQSLDVARGSGQTLETVVLDIANAYAGNNKGLKKYTLGLSAAQLKTASFDDVLKAFNKNFQGANAAYVKTYAGQMNILTVAAGEAQEAIGKGLVDGLMAISGDTSVQDLADSMKELADFTSDAIYGLGSLIGQFNNLKNAAPSWLTSLGGLVTKVGPGGALLDGIQRLSAYGEKKRNQTLQNPSVQMFFTDQANQRLNNEKLKVEKKILDTTKKRAAEDKKAATAKKQAALFDLEKIGLVAALQGKISEEEKLRLNLQLALLTGNDALATKLSIQLANSIDSTGKLAKDLTTLPDAKNPFEAWSAFLDGIIAKAKYAATISGIAPAGVNPPATNVGGFNVSIGASTTGATSSPSGDIIVNIAGSVTSEEDLVAKIRAGIQSGSLSGKQADIGRLAGMFG